jgi:hypothetical protein
MGDRAVPGDTNRHRHGRGGSQAGGDNRAAPANATIVSTTAPQPAVKTGGTLRWGQVGDLVTYRRDPLLRLARTRPASSTLHAAMDEYAPACFS